MKFQNLSVKRLFGRVAIAPRGHTLTQHPHATQYASDTSAFRGTRFPLVINRPPSQLSADSITEVEAIFL